MAEVRIPVSVPESPRRQQDCSLGFIVEDSNNTLVGVYGHNNTPDSFYFEIELDVGGGQRIFRLNLDPGESMDKPLRFPLARRLPLREIPVRGGGTKFILPITQMVKERVYTNPLRRSPTVLSVTETQNATSSTTHNAVMPATVDADDLLDAWVIFGQPDSGTITDPALWTRLLVDSNDDGADFVNAGWWATKALGSEDGANVNFATASATAFISQVYRIEAGTWSGDVADIDVATSVLGTSTTPNIGVITSGMGVGDHLYMVAVGIDNDSVTSSGPAGYTGISEDMNSTSDLHARSAYLVVAGVDNTDPGAFSIDGGDWVAIGHVVPEFVAGGGGGTSISMGGLIFLFQGSPPLVQITRRPRVRLRPRR